MGWCLLPANSCAYFSLLCCLRADAFGWLELWYPQLEAAADCRISSSVCPFLLHLVSRNGAELLAATTEASVRGGSEEAAAQEKDGSLPLECRCWRSFCRAQPTSLEHWTSESSRCFASGPQTEPLEPKCRHRKPDLGSYLDPSTTCDAHCLLDVVTGELGCGEIEMVTAASPHFTSLAGSYQNQLGGW